MNFQIAVPFFTNSSPLAAAAKPEISTSEEGTTHSGALKLFPGIIFVL
jgi:hypothetical protein